MPRLPNNDKRSWQSFRDKKGEKYHDEWDEAKQDYKSKHLFMSALQLMKTGDVEKAVEHDGTTDKSEIHAYLIPELFLTCFFTSVVDSFFVF